ncbi:4898_t:CDS:2, partial [Racocetra persica]
MRTIKYSFLLIFLLGVWVSAIPVAEFPEKRDDYVTSNIFEPIVIPEKPDQPQVRKYTLKLSQKDFAPDGFQRLCSLVNDQYPGPLLQAYKGDTFSITVENDLPVETSMHWHGMFQRGTPWYDGVPGMTQCVIPQKSSFTYEFSVESQSGTYWWHSHYMSQYIDGLLGPLVIHDKDDPYVKEYDYEYVVTLTDWYHGQSKDLLAQFLTPGYTGLNPVPDSGLISGKGQYNCDGKSGSKCSPYAVYKVKKGKKYRFRIINTSAEAYYAFSIDGHKMKIIEVEGTLVKPVEVNQLGLHIAQRYSVIVEANQDGGNFWMRANMSESCIGKNNRTINANSLLNNDVRGILSYEGSDDKVPNSQAFPDEVTPCRNLDSKKLKPLADAPCPDKTDSLSLNVTFGRSAKNVSEARINNSSYVPTYSNPTLLGIIENNLDVKTLPRSQNAHSFDNEKGILEITVFKGAGQKVDEGSLNKQDPPIRDTTIIPANGWSVLRMRTENPGVWSFHCHIEWHIELGMAEQLVFVPSKLKDFKLPDSVK